MKLKSLFLTSALALATSALIPTTSHAATTLIFDDFTRSGTGFLDGSTPTTTTANATWQAFNNASTDTWRTTGTTLTGGMALQQTAAISLGASYWSTNQGVYTLSADVKVPTSASLTSWISLGFMPNGYIASSLGGAMNSGSQTNGQPWILLRQNGGLKVFANGTGTTLADFAAGSFTVGVAVNLKLVLNTSVTNWTLDAFVGATQLDLNGASTGNTYTYGAGLNPVGQYVGLSSSGFSTADTLATVDNFSLTVVPEPATWGLLAFSLTAVTVLRRRRR